MLPSYYRHVCQYQNTLLTKFFGVHCVKPIGGQKVLFFALYCTSACIDVIPKTNSYWSLMIGAVHCDGEPFLF